MSSMAVSHMHKAAQGYSGRRVMGEVDVSLAMLDADAGKETWYSCVSPNGRALEGVDVRVMVKFEVLFPLCRGCRLIHSGIARSAGEEV